MSSDGKLLARLARFPLTYRAAELLVAHGARFEAPDATRPRLGGKRQQVDEALAGLRVEDGSRPLGLQALPSGAITASILGVSSSLVGFARSPSLDLRLDDDARGVLVWDSGVGPRYATDAFDSAWHYLEVVARIGADRIGPDWSRPPSTTEVWFQHARAFDVARTLGLSPVDEATGVRVATWESPVSEVSLIELRIVGHAMHAMVPVHDDAELPAVLAALEDASAVEIWLAPGASPLLDARYRPVDVGASSPVFARGNLSYWTHDRCLARYDALVGSAPPRT